jgi:predicted RNA-binding Zn-ribbon protein involved in translation (DUF1610 family)
MGKPIAHYHNGKKTVVEDFENDIDRLMETAIGTKPKPTKHKPSCPECGAHVKHLTFHPFDFGTDRETGYHDAGERYHCHKCGSNGDADDV